MAKNIDHTLQDDFEYFGKWWLPSKPESVVAGRLLYKAGDSITIELIGAFAEIREIKDFQTDVLYGQTVDGQLCTLWGFIGQDWHISRPTNSPSLTTQSIRFQYLFIGCHFPTLEEFVLSSYQVSYLNLDEWVGENPIRSDVSESMRFSGGLEEPEARSFAIAALGGRFRP